jgi:tRNA-specific 2-thiouridylase
MAKVVVGMSGGIDSTLTAFKLKEEGYEVVGATLYMWDTPSITKAVEDAKKQAVKLGIQHYTIDCRTEFKNSIVNRFVDNYLSGETPSPCAWCNPIIKWNKLEDLANTIGAEYIASGHYIQTIEYNGIKYIQKGVDELKDQSYYMWMLKEKTIRRMLQPLGGMLKEETKQLITTHNLKSVVPTKESMSICFLGGTNYRDFLAGIAPDKLERIQPGKVYDEDGTEIGTHNGIPYYTIGQKRGLNLNIEREAYVSKIDAIHNSIYITTKKGLERMEFEIKEINLLNPSEINPTTALEVKVRGYGLNPNGFGYLSMGSNGKGTIRLEEPAWAISPGQPVVLYINGRLVGGGFAQ